MYMWHLEFVVYVQNLMKLVKIKAQVEVEYIYGIHIYIMNGLQNGLGGRHRCYVIDQSAVDSFEHVQQPLRLMSR